jgi:glycine/D-amino acid oxidase-like deaminating enzyme
VVGDGILGLNIAWELSERNLRVVVFCKPHDASPQADTLRNHGWLQSGLLYAASPNAGNRKAAWEMRESAKNMLQRASMTYPEARGVFRMPAESQQATEFVNAVGELGMSKLVERINEREARERLGPFFLPSFIHFLVPDTTFDQAELLNILRWRLERHFHVEFRPEEVSLVQESASSSGFVIQSQGVLFEAQHTFLCAGSGNVSLLQQLGLSTPLAVFRSALMDVPLGGVMNTPLLVDLSRESSSHVTAGLSVAHHEPCPNMPEGCLVIGSRSRRKLINPEVREVSQEEAADLEKLAPEAIRRHPAFRDRRFVAGHKTEGVDELGVPSVNATFHQWPEYPGLVSANPGKATLAFYSAKRATKDIISRKATAARFIRTLSGVKYHTHPELYYRHVNDLKKVQ